MKEEEMKQFNVRLPKVIWTFLKHDSFNTGLTMNQIITNLLTKYKNKSEKKLTQE